MTLSRSGVAALSDGRDTRQHTRIRSRPTASGLSFRRSHPTAQGNHLPPETIFQHEKLRLELGQRRSELCQLLFGPVNLQADEVSELEQFG